MRQVKVACVQARPQPDFDAALSELEPLLRSAIAEGAEFVALPEYCGGLATRNGRITPPSTAQEQHPVLSALRDIAGQEKVWILVGSLAVNGPEERIRNRSYLLDKSGCIVASYDKIHLFDIQLSPDDSYRESAHVAPGSSAVIAPTPFARIGCSICYDLRFPHLYRRLAQGGADILTVPAAFTRVTGEAHWHVLCRARAIENACFVVAPCAVGPVPGGGETFGHSLIIDPWGTIIADGGTEPGIIWAQIDISEVSDARSRIPSLDHDRDFRLVKGTSEQAA